MPLLLRSASAASFGLGLFFEAVSLPVRPPPFTTTGSTRKREREREARKTGRKEEKQYKRPSYFKSWRALSENWKAQLSLSLSGLNTSSAGVCIYISSLSSGAPKTQESAFWKMACSCFSRLSEMVGYPACQWSFGPTGFTRLSPAERERGRHGWAVARGANGKAPRRLNWQGSCQNRSIEKIGKVTENSNFLRKV